MTIHFRFGSRSELNLNGVKPKLVDVVRRALVKSFTDFAVIEGVRTVARQRELYAKGRTAPGDRVTWTMTSKHITGHAVDLVPINPETAKPDWNYMEGFNEIYRAMMLAAEELQVKIRYGGDWDRDGKLREKGETDSPHFELDE